MKKIIICMTVTLSIVMSSSTVFAGGGSAIMNHWYLESSSNGNSYYYTTLWLSNITPDTVDVEVTFYDMDGDVFQDSSSDNLTGHIRGWGGDSYTEYSGSTNPSVTVSINANETCRIKLTHTSTSQSKAGYALIEWAHSSSSPTKNSKALIAYGKEQYIYNSYYGRATAIEINNGKPF